MPDITLQIVLTAPDHALSGNKKAARYRRGDIVDVITTNTFATDVGGDYKVDGGIGSPRLGFIHIKNVPPTLAQKMRRRLTRDTGDTVQKEHIEPTTGASEMRDEPDPHRRRKWRVSIPDLPAPRRSELLNDKETTMAWLGVRDKIERKIIGNRTAPAADTATPVQDSDLL